MSAGPFTDTAVASVTDPTRVFAIRVQPETVGLSVTIAGAPQVNISGKVPADINETVSMKVTGSRRGLGAFSGIIRFKFVDATSVDGNYLQGSTLALPILNPELYKVKKGNTGTYLGAAITVVGKSPQVIR